MTYITGGVEQEDGHVYTRYMDSVDKNIKTYFFKELQDAVRIINPGSNDIVITINGINTTITSGTESTFLNVIKFNASSENGRQLFNVESWVLNGVSGERKIYKFHGNNVAMMGDSITDFNSNFSQKGYMSWATALSNHQIQFGYRATTGGYTSKQILDTHLPTILNLNPRPNYCIVLAGTNDVGASIDTTITTDNLDTIYEQLFKANIIPICCTIPPRVDNETVKTLVAKLNAWIRLTAMKRGFPFVDFHRVLTEPIGNGAYINGYNSDAIHPSKLGAKIMGAELVRVLPRFLPEWQIPLCTFENTSNPFTNPLFLTDTNADGWPDGGWAKVSGIGTITSAISDPLNGDVVGKWFSMTKLDTPNAIMRHTGVPVVPGNKYALSLRMKVENVDANTLINMNLIQAPNVNTVILTKIFYDVSLNMDACTIYREFVVPDGVTLAQLDISFAAGTGKISIGQITLTDLTAIRL